MQSLLQFVAPSLVLSTVLALLWASLWFAWRGGGWRDWLIAALAALIGFGLGQLIGSLQAESWSLPAVGEVRVVEGTLLCWAMLWAVWWWRRR